MISDLTTPQAPRIGPVERDEALIRMILALEARVYALENPVQTLVGGLPIRMPSVLRVRETLTALVAKVAEAYGVTPSVVMSKRRTRRCAHPRQWVMYEGHLMGFTTAEMGRFFGLDHTTVMHGVRAEKARRGA